MIITKLQVAPVELVVSSESSCAVRLARHSQNACVESNVSSRVESSQVEFALLSVAGWMKLLAAVSQSSEYLYEGKTDVVYLQVTLCDPHLSA